MPNKILLSDANMPFSSQPVPDRLVKLKISTERYNNELTLLLAKGFTELMSNKLILRASSKKTVEFVLNNCNIFLSPSFNLNHQQIVSIAAHDGGSKNIDAVKAAFTELQALGFRAEQIVSIAGNNGGSKNIDAVKAAFSELQALGFRAEQIVSIAAHNGGSKNIDAVKAAFTELQALGFRAEQIVSIAAHDGGSKNIEAVKHYYADLINAGYSINDITDLTSQKSRSGVIKDIVAQNFTAFILKLGVTDCNNNASVSPRNIGLFSEQGSTTAHQRTEEPNDANDETEQASKRPRHF